MESESRKAYRARYFKTEKGLLALKRRQDRYRGTPSGKLRNNRKANIHRMRLATDPDVRLRYWDKVVAIEARLESLGRPVRVPTPRPD